MSDVRPKPVTKMDSPQSTEMVKITLSPPPGMSFKNEFNGDVTCVVQRDKLMDLYNTVQMQLSHQIQFLFKQDVPKQMELKVDENGEIISAKEET